MIAIMNVIMVMIGGILGTLLRYKIVATPIFFGQLKVNVILVNILGSFLAGVFFAIAKRYNLETQYTLLVLIGFCGALTTMSSCVLDTMIALQENRLALAMVHLSLNVLFSLGAVFMGIVISMRCSR